MRGSFAQIASKPLEIDHNHSNSSEKWPKTRARIQSSRALPTSECLSEIRWRSQMQWMPALCQTSAWPRSFLSACFWLVHAFPFLPRVLRFVAKLAPPPQTQIWEFWRVSEPNHPGIAQKGITKWFRKFCNAFLSDSEMIGLLKHFKTPKSDMGVGGRRQFCYKPEYRSLSHYDTMSHTHRL